MVVEVPNDRTETYLNAIRPKISSTLQMVVVIFPTSRDDRYSAFKKLTCIDHPVPSQVSTHTHTHTPHHTTPLTHHITHTPPTHTAHTHTHHTHTQVINARTISAQQKLRSVTQKIALQINCKLGGELWAVEIPVVSGWKPHPFSHTPFTQLCLLTPTEKHDGGWDGRVS